MNITCANHVKRVRRNFMKWKKNLSLLTIAVTSLTASLVFATNTKADSVNVYRLYNKVSMEHLYTASKNEYQSLPKISRDWKQEGINFRAQGNPGQGTKAILRVYNPRSGEHLYTSDNYEAQVLTTKNGWRNEGVAFYSQTKSTKAVYRLYNPAAGIGAHFTTMDAYEKNILASRGWKYEGRPWYAADPSTTTVYVAGTDSKVYWYSRKSLLDYGNKVGNPVNQSQIIVMTEQAALNQNLRHSSKE